MKILIDDTEENKVVRLAVKLKKMKRKYKLNENIFDSMTRESAYWVGFLYGDGNCTCENKIRIALSIKDKQQLIRFRNFVGSDERPIKEFNDTRGYPQCGFEFRSYKIINALRKYELVKKKANRGRLHIDLMQEEIARDFIRGLFDADGSFYYGGLHKNWLYSEITGYKALLKDVKNILTHSGVISDKKKIVKNGSVFRIRLAKDDTIRLIDYIYAKEPRYFLSRKYGMALSYLERLNDKTQEREATVL